MLALPPDSERFEGGIVGVSRQFLVSGRVQGVAYRASAQHKARTLGLQGYAENLPDGRVRVVAQGEPAAVAALGDWLWQGPAMARVSAVDVTECDWQDHGDFAVR